MTTYNVYIKNYKKTLRLFYSSSQTKKIIVGFEPTVVYENMCHVMCNLCAYECVKERHSGVTRKNKRYLTVKTHFF